ncbi:unnamed protein product [Chondrus crispus]|uniref:Uncharacterized protein n=1 Tax=Chondrus crispus TaxID=2769 RepID=R7QNF9_CHOCR|nr:unnamed protein product [Chondrus crispus]CDF39328.1 unnamed protein product [Chondrus crispus]|eukprot:XP_005719239.1 unnamed protein product [Chondrus crispus]
MQTCSRKGGQVIWSTSRRKLGATNGSRYANVLTRTECRAPLNYHARPTRRRVHAIVSENERSTAYPKRYRQERSEDRVCRLDIPMMPPTPGFVALHGTRASQPLRCPCRLRDHALAAPLVRLWRRRVDAHARRRRARRAAPERSTLAVTREHNLVRARRTHIMDFAVIFWQKNDFRGKTFFAIFGVI